MEICENSKCLWPNQLSNWYSKNLRSSLTIQWSDLKMQISCKSWNFKLRQHRYLRIVQKNGCIITNCKKNVKLLTVPTTKPVWIDFVADSAKQSTRKSCISRKTDEQNKRSGWVVGRYILRLILWCAEQFKIVDLSKLSYVVFVVALDLHSLNICIHVKFFTSTVSFSKRKFIEQMN